MEEFQEAGGPANHSEGADGPANGSLPLGEAHVVPLSPDEIAERIARRQRRFGTLSVFGFANLTDPSDSMASAETLDPFGF